MSIALAFPQAKLSEFCRRHRIRKLALFGSVVRDDFGPESDVDVLVEFQRGYVPGLEFGGMGEELSECFGGRYIDLKTPSCLRPATLEKILLEAVTLYGPLFRRPRPAPTHARSSRKSAPPRKRKKTG